MNEFKNLDKNELNEINGGFAFVTVLLGIKLATWAKIGVGALIAGGVAMFGKGVYDGYKG